MAFGFTQSDAIRVKTVAMASIEISVIIPSRNRLGYLQEAIASVQHQTYEDCEAIIIDDASNDGTSAWLRSLVDPRIRSFRFEENRERSASRNYGLEKARGQWVLFLDDDDLLEPRALERLSAELQRSPDAVAAIGAREYFDERGHRRKFRMCHWRTKRVIWPEVLFGLVPAQGEALIRRDAALATGGWNERLTTAEDHEFWLRVSRAGPVVLIPQVVFRLRMHGGQTPPVRIRRTEQRFRAQFVETLCQGDKATGQQILRANRSVIAANIRAGHGQYWKALANWSYAATTAPELLLSPVSLPPLMGLATRWFAYAILGQTAVQLGRSAKNQLKIALNKTFQC